MMKQVLDEQAMNQKKIRIQIEEKNLTHKTIIK